MTFQWTRLLIKRDGSGNKHIYGAFTISKIGNDSLCLETYEKIYQFHGKEGCPVYIRPYSSLYGTARLSADMTAKKKEGYIEMTPGQLKGRWPDLQSQCEQFIVFQLLKNK